MREYPFVEAQTARYSNGFHKVELFLPRGSKSTAMSVRRSRTGSDSPVPIPRHAPRDQAARP